MKARVVILPNGQLSVFVDEGTFEEGRAKLEAFFKELGAKGIKIESVSQAEQHRHDHLHEHVKEVHHG